jgi:hypothetical protein
MQLIMLSKFGRLRVKSAFHPNIYYLPHRPSSPSMISPTNSFSSLKEAREDYFNEEESKNA